jgi:hypothetical protein
MRSNPPPAIRAANKQPFFIALESISQCHQHLRLDRDNFLLLTECRVPRERMPGPLMIGVAGGKARSSIFCSDNS